MDGQQFDRIARAFGSGNSRRSVIKGFAAGIVGVVAGSRSLQGALAQDDACAGHNDVCGEISCCEGMVCSGENVCAWEMPICVGEWEQCGYYEGDVYVECCEGSVCETYGKANYCTYYCTPEGGFCGEITPAGEGYGSICCGDLICGDEETCVPPPVICIPEGDSCAPGDILILSQEGDGPACCEGLVCNDDEVCAPPVFCAAAGESCDAYECCDDLVCDEESGTCAEAGGGGPKPKPDPKPGAPVTKLPDTGAGANGTGSEWLIPTAIGAAAAAVAAHKLREEKQNPSGDRA